MKLSLASSVVVYFVIILCCEAQITTATGAISGKEHWYDQKIGIENTRILNGEEYVLPFHTTSTHPFFDNSSGISGNVIYHGQFYDDLTLLFDIFSDNVILKHRRSSGNYSFIMLDKRKVDAFELGGRKFLKMTPPSPQISSGFFQLLYEGQTMSLVVRRKKTTKVESTGQLDFEISDKYFLIHDSIWTHIKGPKSFSDIFTSKEQSNQLRFFLRSNHIRFREQKEDDLVRISRWYDRVRQDK
jgi:hypothetical protein